MKPRAVFLYLFGHAPSIREVASSRATLWTGLALVLLTSIARNYDQNFVLENPLLWIFGPLAFSLVSATFFYHVTYVGLVRRNVEPLPPFWSGLRSFLGLFWMTAPVAWLYAIPVERFCSSLTATKANIALLATVSCWRVLLMARVMQVLCGPRFFQALVWVLVPATVEIMAVFFFGGGFAQMIMAGMGGMLNSPEDRLLLNAMGTAVAGAFWTFPVVLLVALLWRNSEAVSLPALEPGRVPARFLCLVAVIWIGIACVPQRELAHNAAVDRLLKKGQFRSALDYLSAHRPTDFAPAKPLPPKPYAYESYELLPKICQALRPSDPPWVQQHLLLRLDQAFTSPSVRWRARSSEADSRAEEVQIVVNHFSFGGIHESNLVALIDGLQQVELGRAWLATNKLFLEGLNEFVKSDNLADPSKSRNDLRARLLQLGVSNVVQQTSTVPVAK